MLTTSAPANMESSTAGVMGQRASDLSEDEAHQQTADLNMIFDQYGQRNEEDRREVNHRSRLESTT
jgi:hypothetical protein